MDNRQEAMLRSYARNAVDRTELEAAISALLEERDGLASTLKAIFDAQRQHYGDHKATHLALYGLCEEAEARFFARTEGRQGGETDEA